MAYDLARHLVVTTEIYPELSWGAWLDEAYIDAQEARSLTVLGRHTQATSAFDRALDTLPEGYPRDRGVCLARAAQAYASAGDAEQAAALGVEALKTGQLMGSGRIDRELRSLLEGFQSIDTEPVSEFRELGLGLVATDPVVDCVVPAGIPARLAEAPIAVFKTWTSCRNDISKFAEAIVFVAGQGENQPASSSCSNNCGSQHPPSNWVAYKCGGRSSSNSAGDLSADIIDPLRTITPVVGHVLIIAL